MADGKASNPGVVDETPNGYIAQWLERLTADQQVPGSNPGVPFHDPLRASSIQPIAHVGLD